MTRFEELHRAHEMSLLEYVPEPQRSSLVSYFKNVDICTQNKLNASRTLLLDKLYLEWEMLEGKIETATDNASLTELMKRIKEIKKELNRK